MSSEIPQPGGMRLYDQAARRLYINADERQRFERACDRTNVRIRSFALTLLYTGCRISEALALTPQSIQEGSRVITIRTLKRRRPDCFREVPVSEALLQALEPVIAQCEPNQLLWRHHNQPLNRSTAYRWIKALMREAKITGPQASPKGLRHGYGIHALQSGVPLNMLQKWMGHADMTTTSIYGDACGREEREIARRMW